MLEYIIIEYRQVIVNRRVNNNRISLKNLSLHQKALLLFMCLSAMTVIIFTWLWVYAPFPNNYGTYLVFSLVIAGLTLYSIIKVTDDKFAEELSKHSHNYKQFILENVREILKRNDLYTKYKIEILVQQINDKLPETESTMNLFKRFAEILLLPLFIALFGAWMNNEGAIAIFIYTIAILVIIFALLLIISPSMSLVESTDKKTLKFLRKELQDILIVDFGN